MARFCAQCGKELAEGQIFCTECGTPAPKENLQSVKYGTYTYESEPVKQSYPTPQPATVSNASNSKNITASTGYFFWMKFLYAIPVLGWIVCLVTALSEKNPSKKHFAIASLIWIIIGTVLSIILFYFLRWLFTTALTRYITEMDNLLKSKYLY